MPEDYRLLAAVIAAHPNRQIAGRTRLQKTVKLLQSLGLETCFGYSIHFYGPYSEDLQACLGLLERIGLAREERFKKDNCDEYYYVEKATEAADPALVKQFQDQIDIMAKADPVTLELAATYQAFREEGEDKQNATVRLRRKKAAKCVGDNEAKALKLLKEVGIEE